MRLSVSLSDFSEPLPWLLRGIAALFAGLTLWLCVQANTFPSAYHPDEPSKARQVIAGEFNFHHPMLMLSVTRAALVATGTPLEPERVTVVGRWVSAAFTAGAVFFLVLVAGALGGVPAAAVAGALLATNHQLFELAHYFKEDPALLFGMSAFFLALLRFDQEPSLRRSLLLGLGLGLAVSGKYLGALMIPVAVAMLILHRRELSLPRSLGFAGLGFVLVVVAANLPAFLQPGGFAAGLTREVGFAVEGHKGITRSVPHGVYAAVFRESTNPAIWILLIAYAISLVVRGRRVSRAEWMIALFPLVYGVLLSFFPKTHHRYFLPATGVLLTLAALGLATLPRFVWDGRPLFGRLPARLVVAVALAVTLLVQTPRFRAYYSGFHNDARAALATWLRANVPPGSVIVQDKRVNLAVLNVPYELRGKLFAADVGTIDELRAAGIRYVAVSEGDYGRFFLDSHQATAAGSADFTRRREFYRRLFAEGDKVFELPAGTLQYLQPSVRLYRLPPPSP